VVFENASGELEMWSKSAQSQVEMQLRERRRGFTRRRDALQRVQGATGELEAASPKCSRRTNTWHASAGQGGRAGRRSRGRSAGSEPQARQHSGRTLLDQPRAGHSRHPLATPAWPPRPALAGHARPLPRLAVGDHAAADAGGHRHRLLPALPGSAFPTCKRWPRRRWTTCWRCGAGWATTAARATCTAARRPWCLAWRRLSAHSAQLATLPGIGRSTAAAIAAFCFGERAAILDGNVKRVLTRALGFDEDLAGAAAQQRLWAEAEALLPRATWRSTPRA
jgi:hypothetical protein